MHTLLLRLAGPMQSWGIDSRFTSRNSELEPSKSGVIGLCCAALGRPREADISDLAQLRMGVRIDSPGIIKRDYQTAMNVIRATGKSNPDAVTSTRFYLADSNFLVGLESPDYELLKSIQNALQKPVWQIFLGRKSYVPGIPVYISDGLCKDTKLKDALIKYPYVIETEKKDESGEQRGLSPSNIELPIILEMPAGQIGRAHV